MSQFGPPFLTSLPPSSPPQDHSSCCKGKGTTTKRWFVSGSGSERLCRANSTEFMSNGCRQRREDMGTHLQVRLIIYPHGIVMSSGLFQIRLET